jgi:hypothetical protein
VVAAGGLGLTPRSPGGGDARSPKGRRFYPSELTPLNSLDFSSQMKINVCLPIFIFTNSTFQPLALVYIKNVSIFIRVESKLSVFV